MLSNIRSYVSCLKLRFAIPLFTHYFLRSSNEHTFDNPKLFSKYSPKDIISSVESLDSGMLWVSAVRHHVTKLPYIRHTSKPTKRTFMFIKTPEHKEAWNTIFIFLAIVTAISAVFHYAIVNLYPSRIYIGALMWCPAIAAIITLKLRGRSISSLNWNWGNWKYIRWSYFIPALYVLITYIFIWIFGLGGLPNEELILAWAKELGLVGIGTLQPTIAVIVGVILLGTVGVVRAMATTLGEEIGWRGFFIYELRKVLSFSGVSLFSGIVWASWHWPIIVYYGGNVPLELTAFFVVLISMSFVMTYYTFKSKSLWPAVIFHAVSNVYVQKVFPPLTRTLEETEHWLGENGIMFAIVTLVFGIYFWRKGVKENL